MFGRTLLQASQPRASSVCLFCSARRLAPLPQTRLLSATSSGLQYPSTPVSKAKTKTRAKATANTVKDGGFKVRLIKSEGTPEDNSESIPKKAKARRRQRTSGPVRARRVVSSGSVRARKVVSSLRAVDVASTKQVGNAAFSDAGPGQPETKSLMEAMLGETPGKRMKGKKNRTTENLPIEILSAENLDFEPIDVEIPPVPILSHGLDRVLFNPGIYRLQDPRSRIYNFDPYLEKIMPVTEFDFEALSEYKTSSKDEDLLAITKRLGTKFTGSTSSMSGVLQHFHYLLSNWRELNHDHLSRKFPAPSPNFSKIQRGPSAIFLRWKDGVYAIDADKSYDSPNIMSWLGHSLEKLLTNSPEEFERYRRSSTDQAPSEDESGKCYHYSKLGNLLMRSQLDARDPRLPGTGVFDLKTRAVVSIRMNHREYESGLGYQLRYDQGEWESFEREFYDMSRATMLKYSLQVRMGRMDGIFVAFHNIERIFGFQYVSLPDMDYVLHGQKDTTLGDQEFKLSISLLDEILQRATNKFPETSIRLHFETRETSEQEYAFMYIFAEPVTEARADEIQYSKEAARREFERNIIGVKRDDPVLQAEWRDIQERIDEEIGEDELNGQNEGDEEGAQESPPEDAARARESAEDEAPKDQAAANATESADTPLMGWTLTVRNRVNGKSVSRPHSLTPSDSWSLEYHIKEISPDSQRRIYSMLLERRRRLVGLSEEKTSEHLKLYRELIQGYSKKGRKWREEQDKIDEQIGQRVYTRLGPGSEKVV